MRQRIVLTVEVDGPEAPVEDVAQALADRVGAAQFALADRPLRYSVVGAVPAMTEHDG